MDKYHIRYSELAYEEIVNRLKEKKEELRLIFLKIPFNENKPAVKIAVMGCGDKRYIQGHKIIFQEVLKKTCEITTFDINVEHLNDKERVIKHDCVLPLPKGPYDIIYAHVLLKFIETEIQWSVIKNSYDALAKAGLAIHILDKENYETKGSKLSDSYFSVPLKRWKEKLNLSNINYQEIPVKYGKALVLIK